MQLLAKGANLNVIQGVKIYIAPFLENITTNKFYLIFPPKQSKNYKAPLFYLLICDDATSLDVNLICTMSLGL